MIHGIEKLAGMLPALALLFGLLVGPQEANAQFAVFDASSFATMGHIWNEDVSTNVKLAQELAQATKIATQTLQLYSLAMQETQLIAKGHILQAVGFFAQHAAIPGQPGWNNALSTAGGLANAGVAWQQMTNPNLSMQNRIQLIDSFATSALNSIGSCQVAAMGNDASLGAVEAMAMSMGGAANTAANQRSIANMTAAQQTRYHQCEQNLAQQQAKLALLHVQEMRDRDQRAITTNTNIDNYNAGGAGEWNTSPAEDITRTGMH